MALTNQALTDAVQSLTWSLANALLRVAKNEKEIAVLKGVDPDPELELQIMTLEAVIDAFPDLDDLL